ncbi:tRNA (adenosine(37)-N6)-threonylcarbamoyltransferase complex dimerization subunit type 1 TsaB [Gemella sp. GH3]|uniref:tRNA (adenosine(37)-N6)-threonylcarbamoyltransferase complex dimerization subunit type 1 TsaB n=1 Tax=unclassified Gemella TaxID=2624949 RepID=UPI0015CF9714|nr:MULTISPECIES: tRNA (adenosine(37)-N6)-threonylcarbamoyltransferase complex dimerization subunit type 1 TsaB [unclassified Gemella]MBF0713894.1 tRNA (adenosine(37)-N6)-threonylcarbamoyltransferase complex dimerization subunit type 1 TsaB [Gemella sp. GH3.1]NYS50846.1 tRNA (adenosine(37)-N6)-threonylcarbamoyltransferase complex dimerization subunit type 1 TsaB [Gemella sp. GH3]
MVSLVIDGSNNNLSICCIKEDKILSKSSIKCYRNLSEIILKEVDNCLDNASIKKNDITEIIVTGGPGSYTALRVVLSIAKTLSYVLKIPIKTISSLRLFSANCDKNVLTVPLFDGRRGNVYSAIYLGDEEILKEGYYAFKEVIDYINKENKAVNFVTNSDNFEYNDVEVDYKVFIKDIDAADYLFVKNFSEEVDSFTAVPNYLRLTEAERNLINDKN